MRGLSKYSKGIGVWELKRWERLVTGQGFVWLTAESGIWSGCGAKRRASRDNKWMEDKFAQCVKRMGGGMRRVCGEWQ